MNYANKFNFLAAFTFPVPQGAVTYTRKNLRHSSMPDWGKVDKGLTKLVPLLQGTIEDDGAGMLQVDFANRYSSILMLNSFC